jgi:hypothetical protein
MLDGQAQVNPYSLLTGEELLTNAISELLRRRKKSLRPRRSSKRHGISWRKKHRAPV